MRKISLAEYIAANGQPAAINLLRTYGYPVSASPSHPELTKMISKFIINEREKGLVEVALIHPDRELLLENGQYSNCSGDCSCGGSCKGSSSADGQSDANKMQSTLNLLPSTANGNTGITTSHQSKPINITTNELLLGISVLVVLVVVIKKI